MENNRYTYVVNCHEYKDYIHRHLIGVRTIKIFQGKDALKTYKSAQSFSRNYMVSLIKQNSFNFQLYVERVDDVEEVTMFEYYYF